MWVKICGNTNLEDAQLAAKLGADALGFVFAESKRQVTPQQVAAITPHLPGAVERVGVFSSRDVHEITAIVHEASLNAVQLHGGLDTELIARLFEQLGSDVGLIQTLHWTVGHDTSTSLAMDLRKIVGTGTVKRVLVDSRVGQVSGGTGVAFDWRAARTVLDQYAKELKVIVAGGLRPENVAEAIQQLRPWGVDVVSGVEVSPGRKDPAKLAEFLRITKET